MTKSTLAAFVLVVSLMPIAHGFASDQRGIDALTSNGSPLAKGEVIAFFGDSITREGALGNGYCRLIGDALQKQRPDLETKVVYSGIGGHKVPNLQQRLDRDVLSQKPTVVFIYIGINDVWHSQRNRGTPKDKFESGLRDLISKIKGTGADVILCTPSVIGEKTDGSNPLDAMLEEYSVISRTVAADNGLTVCDLRKYFLRRLKDINKKNKDKGILTRDGVHLNAAGNKFVADRAAEAIAREVGKRAITKLTEPISLFNGKDLTGWHVDIPAADQKPDIKPTFVVRDGNLVSLGSPQGHIITDARYQNYRLEVEYRFAAKPGNCGVLVHASTPRSLYKMFPMSIEAQMNHKHAGDFWCIVEDITVPDMVKRRGPKEKWGIVEGKARRILNLTDDSEKPLGEWNNYVIECFEDSVKVWVNGDLVNFGTKCTARSGQIALQAEGAEVEFRQLILSPIATLSAD